jgi:ubiquitin-protein ligase
MSGNKDVSAFPDGDNLFRWAATVKGSAGTPFEGMTFKLRMEFPAEYPYKAPSIFFSTAVSSGLPAHLLDVRVHERPILLRAVLPPQC